MSDFWLVPLSWDGETALLGGERLRLEPADLRMRFLEAMGRIHPRLLMMFKAHLLPEDESGEVCGTEELPFALAQSGDIRLSAAAEPSETMAVTDALPTWRLSHCAEAYLNRMLTAREAAGLLRQVEAEPEAERWLNAMRTWTASGRQVILLRED
ncbi:hypothetical protein SAMN04487970_100972 [Paenibacillus tianmuensis]|uniref:Uncharacterized protein n=1 Tax=Paenibacillus tianmuensis TaxID=624147 RepID=A0A1G4QVU9_9BACL|nr:hypothetical protein [Paenibacillus tianmuensis]SCW48682.1 hypothetical protein SAMN04487970_100972 [Paenibacillus tianmuensis]